ncbi:calcium-binding protein [Caulobacter sp.]|uniref:calcium-binding protein n=1 Tax=Caulobacter sp. TaxID=78 RepID=UPI002B4A9666|nr:calcium-binding protein [Caulobacter sp.]HJV41072.1 calcium-binding protein [Caulobacter sp.]
MGEILAFAPRPPAGDWTANERGLLLLLTQQLASSYGEVDGVFGQTDSGDPWYVVTDANQDVLVHVARIDGQFVVHDAAIDMFHQVGSLWGALRQVLSSGAAEEPGGVVVAFNPASREAQSFLSLVIAVGLYLELRDLDLGVAGRLDFDSLPRADDPAIEGVAAKLIAALNLEADRAQGHSAIPTASTAEAAIAAPPQKSVLLQDVAVGAPSQGQEGLGPVQASHPEAAPSAAARSHAAPAPQSPEPQSQEPREGQFELTASDIGAPGTGFIGSKAMTSGTAGADTMVGTSDGDTIAGGAGDDYIDGRGARQGQVDRIDGGAGDDRIVMNARVVASGSAGADTFLVAANAPTTKAEALLGVVLDYSAAKGDHLAVLGAGVMTIVSTAAVSDVLAAQGATLGEATAAMVTDVTKVVAGTRVGFDVNGDGREDVFILLGGATTSTFKLNTTIANDHTDTTVPLVGQPSGADIAGHAGDPPATR